jgi:YebC/PmpR family DNA-binding regulatory protein
MSGHSKWATIKHKKGAADARRGKLFSRLIKEIQVAARMGGGDITGNPRLRKAVAEAKSNQMPSDNIDRAIKRGTGELDGSSYDEVLYEGTGAGGTLWIVQALTDNRNRTVAELRKVFEKHAGVLGGSGSAGWAFDRKGIVLVAEDAANEERLLELTMDHGAEDVSVEEGQWRLLCDVNDLDTVTSALEGADVKVEKSAPGYVPKVKKSMSGKDAERCLGLYEALDDHDDVQEVFPDFDVSDEELERIQAESA